MSERKLRKFKDQSESFNLQELHHPLKTYLFYGLTVSSIIFLSLLFTFIIWLDDRAGDPTLYMSKAFLVSPYFLMLSLFASTYIIRSYRQEATTRQLLALCLSMLTGIVFAVLQVYGCISIIENSSYTDFNLGYIIIIASAGLHLLFIGFGLLYLFYLTLKVYDNWNDPVKSLVYYSNFYEVSRLELISIYWYYTCILWPLLFFTFFLAI